MILRDYSYSAAPCTCMNVHSSTALVIQNRPAFNCFMSLMYFLLLIIYQQYTYWCTVRVWFNLPSFSQLFNI